MWYEILPSAGIVFACVVIPPYGHWVVNKLTKKGKNKMRNWEVNPFDAMMYQRDRRITGSEYKPKGLECIPAVKN